MFYIRKLDIVVKNGNEYFKEYHVDDSDYDIINKGTNEIYFAFDKNNVTRYVDNLKKYNLIELTNHFNKAIFNGIEDELFYSKMQIFSLKDNLFTFYFYAPLMVNEEVKKIINLTNNNDLIYELENIFNKPFEEISSNNIYGLGIDYDNQIKPYVKIYFENLIKEEKVKLQQQCDSTIEEVKDKFNIKEDCYLIHLVFEEDNLQRYSYYFE